MSSNYILLTRHTRQLLTLKKSIKNKMEIRKKFEYEGIELRIVEREEPYLNAIETLTMTRVLAPNGGVIPVKIQHRQTLKSIVEDTISLLDGFKKRGADVKKELLKSKI